MKFISLIFLFFSLSLNTFASDCSRPMALEEYDSVPSSWELAPTAEECVEEAKPRARLRSLKSCFSMLDAYCNGPIGISTGCGLSQDGQKSETLKYLYTIYGKARNGEIVCQVRAVVKCEGQCSEVADPL